MSITKILSSFLIVSLFACSNSKPMTEAEQREIDNQLNTKLTGSDAVDNPYGSLSDFLKSNENKVDDGSTTSGNVNLRLWQAAVNVLANYGIFKADPSTGTIITTWSHFEGSNEKFQLVVQVIGSELLSKNVQATGSVRTITDSKSSTKPMNSQVTSQLKDVILLRARELRINQ